MQFRRSFMNCVATWLLFGHDGPRSVFVLLVAPPPRTAVICILSKLFQDLSSGWVCSQLAVVLFIPRGLNGVLYLNQFLARTIPCSVD